MFRYIALMRGINVGGHNMIKMSDLKRMCEEMGLGAVQTYIQSGNVLFTSDEAEEPLRQRLEQQIQAAFNCTVPVVLRTAGEWEQILANCPFETGALGEGEALFVTLLAEAPSQEAIDRLPPAPVGGDEYRVVGREIYLLCRQPYHKTKLSNAFFEQKLRVAATSRNWQTMTKLLELANA